MVVPRFPAGKSHSGNWSSSDRIFKDLQMFHSFEFPEHVMREIVQVTSSQVPGCERKCLKPWSNGPAICRKWTQVELTWRLTLGDQTDSQVFSQVHATRKKKNILRQNILYFIG